MKKLVLIMLLGILTLPINQLFKHLIPIQKKKLLFNPYDKYTRQMPEYITNQYLK